MIGKILAAAGVMLLGAVAGATFGLWWVNSSNEAICVRLVEDCGQYAMPLDECLAGRQQDLFSNGVLATRRVKSCLAEAPRDCLSVTACIAANDGTDFPFTLS